MKSARLLGLLAGMLILASLACSAPALPVLVRAQPTSTPRPTRTSRPTFTPTPSDTPTPVFTPTPTRTNTPTVTNTPIPPTVTNTPVPPTPTNTRRPIPPTATFTPAPPAPPTNTPAPSFAFRPDGDPRGWANCTTMGVFGVISNSGGGRMAGITIQVYITGGAKVPGDDPVSTNRSDDRNWELTMFHPGAYQVVLYDPGSGREVSPRVNININFMDQCDVQAGQPGSQWVQVNFRQN